MNTWLDWCVRRPGPPDKCGYSGHPPERELAAIEGECKHSMEGSLAPALSRLDSTDQASWTFSVDKAGNVYQHYPLEAVTWAQSSYEANRRYVSEEHEGRVGEPLTAPQLAATIRLTQEIRARCAAADAQPPTTRVNLWEHNWCCTTYGGPPTSCPSGRIPWDEIIAQINAAGGDNVTQQIAIVKSDDGGAGRLFWTPEHGFRVILFADLEVAAQIAKQGNLNTSDVVLPAAQYAAALQWAKP